MGGLFSIVMLLVVLGLGLWFVVLGMRHTIEQGSEPIRDGSGQRTTSSPIERADEARKVMEGGMGSSQFND